MIARMPGNHPDALSGCVSGFTAGLATACETADTL